MAKRVVCGPVGDGEPGSLLLGQAVGKGKHVDRRDQPPLGEGAMGDRGDHRRTDLQRHAIADGGDRSGALQSGRERWVGSELILPLHDQRVREVHRRDRHVDHHLTRTGRRVGQLTELETINRAELATDDRAHQCAVLVRRNALRNSASSIMEAISATVSPLASPKRCASGLPAAPSIMAARP